MTEPIDLICFECKHFEKIQLGCAAFPEGIPDKILRDNEHSKPLPGQKNDLVFTQKDKTEKK